MVVDCGCVPFLNFNVSAGKIEWFVSILFFARVISTESFFIVCAGFIVEVLMLVWVVASIIEGSVVVGFLILLFLFLFFLIFLVIIVGDDVN